MPLVLSLHLDYCFPAAAAVAAFVHGHVTELRSLSLSNDKKASTIIIITVHKKFMFIMKQA